MKRYFVSYLFKIKGHSLNFGNTIVSVKKFELNAIIEYIKEAILKEFSNVSKDDIGVGIMFFKELEKYEV